MYVCVYVCVCVCVCVVCECVCVLHVGLDVHILYRRMYVRLGMSVICNYNDSLWCCLWGIDKE